MKLQNKSLGLMIGIVAALGIEANAQQFQRPDFSKMDEQMAACEQSQYNTNGVTLPRPSQRQRGQRPDFSQEQFDLLKACVDAGILQMGPRPGAGARHWQGNHESTATN